MIHTNPFGLKVDVDTALESRKYRYGYQGEFSEDETDDNGFNSFEARMYYPVIGRWMSVDPARQYASGYVGMGNNPVSGVDPDGEYSLFGATWRNIVNGGDGIFKDGNEWAYTSTGFDEKNIMGWVEFHTEDPLLSNTVENMPGGGWNPTQLTLDFTTYLDRGNLGFGLATAYGEYLTYNKHFAIGKNLKTFYNTYNKHGKDWGNKVYSSEYAKRVSGKFSKLGNYSAGLSALYGFNQLHNGEIEAGTTTLVMTGIGMVDPLGASFAAGYNSGFILESLLGRHLTIGWRGNHSFGDKK
ncbi:hypothetical protein EI427_17335 [Flammeovirga pectinis]|uniref:RHS repeat-associated core domain-containing protein n=1 Tax=Flammeovirga pectinis TaxID=2494373 RepID=A0A3S9P711_9BACT|nr:RHS repeat-associated core domain-containing protein [Flammeovirga pectinis]AZQ63924.1 hypothetical protein EI427_17335 [Flammeovirga pectinis]